jgi:HlyD family secretion protein
VIDSVEVAEGDRVEQGQIIATLATRPLRLAQVERLEAELEQAQHDEARLSKLSRGNAASAAKSDTAEIAVRIAQANLNAAVAELALSEVRSPIAGEVLEVHARAGELIGPEGVVELGETDRMYAIAEVYETDVGLVRIGQRARLSSPALAEPLTGSVDRIGMKIGRMDVIGTDPIAKTDARVVEVRIALDDSEKARALTHLQVEVEIEP